MRRISKDGWVLISLILLLTIVSALTGRNKDDAYTISRTSYSYQPDGTGALYETLRTLGYKPKRNLMSLDRLADNGVLFITSPSIPLSGGEKRWLRTWAYRGNLVVYSDTDIYQLLSSEAEKETVKYHAAIPSVFSAGAQTVEISTSNSCLNENSNPLDNNDKNQPIVGIYSANNGNAVEFIPYGKGGVLHIAGGWFLSNQGISKADNFRLIVNTLDHWGLNNGYSIYIDEFHHGYSQSDGILSLLDTPAKIALVQLVIAFLVLMIAASRRFGRAVPLQERTRQRGEYLGSMSSILHKSKASSIVHEVLGKKFLNDIAKAVGLPANAGVEAIVDTASQKYPNKAQSISYLCRAADNKLPLSEAAVFELAQQWHILREELTK